MKGQLVTPPPEGSPEAPPAMPAAENSPIMALRGLHKSFGSVQALKGVDLLVRRGEVHAIVGENGAGKSTLIGIAAGVLAADAGSINLDGAQIAAPSARLMREAGVSVVYQHPALAPDLTILENLQLAAPSLAGAHGGAEALALLGRVAGGRRLSLDRRVADLSLVERHVVEIARALASAPRVVFFDEPTEPFQQADIRVLFDLIKRMRAEGIAIVYVSHRLHEIDELADRVSVMRDGEIIDSRPAAAITASDIITLIAGRPLGQIFPAKATAVGAPVFEIEGLSGGGFHDVALVAHAGEIVGLAGVEGEGQREFLRAAAGLERRAAGTIKVRGQAVQGATSGAARRAGIGFVSDDRHAEGLFLSLAVRENLGIGMLGQIAGNGVVDRAEEIARSTAIVEQLRVRAASLEQPVSSLSGGNQQKILIGREMAAKPTVLLVDEPTKGVDIGARTEIYQKLRDLAAQGLAVVIASSDGIELEGLCDRVLVFARGGIVKELKGATVNDSAITEANLTATASRAHTQLAPGRGKRWHGLFGSDHFPAIILAAITAVILGGTELASPFFLSPFNIQGMLVFLALLAFVAIAQLATVLVGAIDLSIGALAGLTVVLASFVTPDGASGWELAGGVVLIMLGATGFGLLQGLLVARLGLPAIIVTLGSFIGLQGVSLLLRPRAEGTIADFLSDSAQFPIAGIPAATIFALAVVGVLEWLLYRSAVGRQMRAVGSSPLASLRVGLDKRRLTLLAFSLSGALTGVAGLMLAGQIGVGSAVTGVDYTLMSLTAVVLGGASIAGGRGSVLSTLLGCALVQATSSASSFVDSDSSLHYAVLGVVTLAAAIFFSIARRQSRTG